MKIPRPISKLIDSFQRLPGIGPKTAQRLTFHLLHFPQEEIQVFADNLANLKLKTVLCSVCKNVSLEDVCDMCSNGDGSRNVRKIAIVSSPLDAFALAKTGYDGVFHVLHGLIDPLNNIGPEELFVNELVNRLKQLSEDSEDEIEAIMATNTSMEGEATAIHLLDLIKQQDIDKDRIKVSRIARGLPVGGDIEYADDITLSKSLEGRSLM